MKNFPSPKVLITFILCAAAVASVAQAAPGDGFPEPSLPEKVCGDISTRNASHPMKQLYVLDRLTLVFTGDKGVENLQVIEESYKLRETACVIGYRSDDGKYFEVQIAQQR